MINREDEKATIDYVAGLNEKYSSKKAKEHTYRSVIEIFMANIGNDLFSYFLGSDTIVFFI